MLREGDDGGVVRGGRVLSMYMAFSPNSVVKLNNRSVLFMAISTLVMYVHWHRCQDKRTPEAGVDAECRILGYQLSSCICQRPGGTKFPTNIPYLALYVLYLVDFLLWYLHAVAFVS